MEKQHNRGQDGAGIAAVKLQMNVGQPTSQRLRISGQHAIGKIFQDISDEVNELTQAYPDLLAHPDSMKGYLRFAGELLLGHLRYGTQGKNNVEFCHPFVKPHIEPGKHLTMAGNFNLINTDELYQLLPEQPSATMKQSDLGAMIATIHHHLCLAHDAAPNNVDLVQVLQDATRQFDGGYVFAGLLGNGDSFIMRDPNGIRPCYYYQSDEVIAAASERAALMTTFNVKRDDIIKLEPGHALIVSASGNLQIAPIIAPRALTACSFERIYFSRGSDPEIYRERMQLGRNLAPHVLEALEYHLKHTIVSFIPNTAETAFYGLIKGLEDYLKDITLKRIMARKNEISEAEMRELIYRRVRIEKIAIKDAKLRTFITEDAARNEMVQHVYDITYGTVERGVDTLVIIDDSIVRGTTLRESIIKMLDRLGPKRIIIVSSAPQIRYPDCYGIDMSKMGDFIAFQAAIALLKDQGSEHIIQDTYNQCVMAMKENRLEEHNYVKQIYASFTDQDISNKIAAMLKHEDVGTEVDVIYQTLEGLYDACPTNKGDWYFTGNYPTPGGNKVANRAFMNYVEQKEGRGY